MEPWNDGAIGPFLEPDLDVCRLVAEGKLETKHTQTYDDLLGLDGTREQRQIKKDSFWLPFGGSHEV